MRNTPSTLDAAGYEAFGPVVGTRDLTIARDTLFADDRAGTRCLLDEPVVRDIAIAVRHTLAAAGRLSPNAVAIQAIAFDKTPSPTGR